MKRISAISQLLIILISFSSCQGQTRANEERRKAGDVPASMSPRGLLPGSGIYMKAKINGKAWEAANLFPDPDPTANTYRVNGEKDGVRIDFYVPIARSYAGTTHKFNPGSAPNFCYPDDAQFYTGRSGSYTITKIDNDGFEVSFQFTATDNEGGGKVFEISDGTLRFPFQAKK